VFYLILIDGNSIILDR